MVDLYAREHYIAHVLLYKMEKNKRRRFQMLKALVMMKGREQFEFNSRTYENFRIEFGKRQSEWMIKNNPMKGKKLSNKRRNEISIRRKEYLSNKENHPFFGKNHKEESNIKNRESNSLRIKIFDNNGELKFECNVGLEIFCKENDLPLKFLRNHIRLMVNIDYMKNMVNVGYRHQEIKIGFNILVGTLLLRDMLIKMTEEILNILNRTRKKYILENDFSIAKL